jgi:serine kinase of HPr protein (carbohydrate metabolism regulator)
MTSSIHASAVLVGATALLIRGPAGSGKSSLAWDVLKAAEQGALRFARLVGDDRVHIEAHGGRLLVRPAAALAGLLEIRGLGIRRLPYEPVAVIGLLVDLAAPDAARLPEPQAAETTLFGVPLSRLPVGAGQTALPAVLAILNTLPADN